MNLTTLQDAYGLSEDAASDLMDYTQNIREAMERATNDILYMGMNLKGIRDKVFKGVIDDTRPGFKSYCASDMGLSFGYVYKLIKAWDTYGSIDEATKLSSTVLLELMRDKDPKERLKEALAAQEGGTKVTVAAAKELVKKAKAIIESGETETFAPVPAAQQREVVADLEREMGIASSTTGVTPETVSLCRKKKIVRAKRLLNTVIDLLAVELANADLTAADMHDAVAEMLLSSDSSESESIQQLREFCELICKPII